MPPDASPALARDYEGVLPEARLLAALAWPISLTLLTTVAMGAVDTLLIGRLGEDPLAALGQANIWTWSIITLARGTLRSLESTMTQAMGAGDREREREVFCSGIGAALALSFPVVGFYLLAGEGLRLLGQPAQQIPLASAYCIALSPGVFARLVEGVIQTAVNARGRTRPPFVATLLGNAINVVLAIVLIYGVGPFDGWGVVGAGVAATIATFAELGILVWLVWDDLVPLWSGWRPVFAPGPVWQTVRRGFFLGVQAAIETCAFQFAGVMVGWMGSAALAGHTIALNIGIVAYMIPFGVATATTVRIGNLVGAGKRWGRAAALAVAFGTAVTFVAMFLFVAFPGPISAAYTNDADVLLVAAALLPLCGAFQLFDGIQTVAQGVLRALGDFAVPALLNLVAFWIVGLPVGYLLAFPGGLGPRGVWIGLTVGLLVTAILMGIRVRFLQQRAAQLGSQRQNTRAT